MELAVLHTLTGVFCPARRSAMICGKATSTKKPEVLRLTEEVRLVGGNDIDQMNAFAAQAVTLEDMFAVVRQVGGAGGHDALAQPALDHVFLRLGHLDAAVVLDEPGETGKVPRAQMVGAARHRIHIQPSQATLRSATERPSTATSSLENSRARSKITTNPSPRRPTPRM